MSPDSIFEQQDGVCKVVFRFLIIHKLVAWTRRLSSDRKLLKEPGICCTVVVITQPQQPALRPLCCTIYSPGTALQPLQQQLSLDCKSVMGSLEMECI